MSLLLNCTFALFSLPVNIYLMKVFRSIIVILLLLGMTVYARAEERTLTILYTGGMAGQLEPCGCSPKTDFGGLARLSGYISGHAEEISPYLLVDAGNFTGKDTPQGRLKAEAILRAFNATGYDAVAFGENERAFPGDLLSPLVKENETPVVCALNEDRKMFTLERGGFNIHLSADPDTLQEGGLNLLLLDRAVADAKLIKGWDVIITSSGEELEVPLEANGTVITAGFPKGKELGVLRLRIGTDGNITGYDHRWQPLGNDIAEDPEVRRILDDYDAKVAGLLKEAEIPPAGTTYSGVKKCAECHQPFEESWKETRHAGAFASLVDAGKGGDPECIICHSVGFGEEGGFHTIETTPELANVQCEACHGLDREHLEDFSRPLRPVTEKVCQKCHTKENSPDFDYPVYLEMIKH